MGVLALVEDRPTPKAVYNWRVYTAAAVASFASCMVSFYYPDIFTSHLLLTLDNLDWL